MRNIRKIIWSKSFDTSSIRLYAEKAEDQILLTKEKILYCCDPEKVKELEDKLIKKESEFNELKQLIKLSELLIESARDIYSDTLNRMPSLFVEDRDYLETLLWDVSDLGIFLDCYWKWACFDHHWLNFTEWNTDTKVAVSKVLDFIDENNISKKELNQGANKPLWTSLLIQLYELCGALQKKDRFNKQVVEKSWNKPKIRLKEFLNDFIPMTSWYLDTDSILSHFALLYPKDARKHRDLINDAALNWDLNLKVSEQSQELHKIITWIAILIYNLRKYYSNNLDLDNKNKLYKVNKNDWSDEELTWEEFENRKKMKLAIFDTVVWNAILNMVPEMIKYITNPDFNETNDLYKLFSKSSRLFQKIIDEKVLEMKQSFSRFPEYTKLKWLLNNKSTKEEINKVDELRKKGVLEIEVVDNVVYFSYNKEISLSYSWIPPEAFYQYLSTSENVEFSKLNYCVICLHKGDKNSKTKAKSIFVSNIPHSKKDLKHYSLRDKVSQLNELEEKSLWEFDVFLSHEIVTLEKDIASEVTLINKDENNKKITELINKRNKIDHIRKICNLRGVFHWRNWLAFLSSSYSSLDDVIKVLTNNEIWIN